jgi:hypothetical protein
MPNHVHLVQARRKRTGHCWQGRFGAGVMDEQHLAVSLSPVRARLVKRHGIGAGRARARICAARTTA